ncbi:MAG: hypothetical protein IJJ28_03990 [Lentisphaeria bacterium]|nr:hypothetical protein [Lentisphaeria bacterium]
MKKMMALILAAVAAASLTGCVSDGTDYSFQEIDRKYSESAWTAAATYVPIIGPIFIGLPLIAQKDADYYKVLLKKPDTEAYEVLRHQYRYRLMYCPHPSRRY